MQGSIRAKYYATLTKVQNGVSQGCYLLGLQEDVCDQQSACAKAAREIVVLIERKKDTADQNRLVKEEILLILDHDQLLTEYRCHALALLTLAEAHRQLLYNAGSCAYSASSRVFLEELQVFVRQHFLSPGDMEEDELKVLVPKHVGNGMKYLSELFKKNSASGPGLNRAKR